MNSRKKTPFSSLENRMRVPRDRRAAGKDTGSLWRRIPGLGAGLIVVAALGLVAWSFVPGFAAREAQPERAQKTRSKSVAQRQQPRSTPPDTTYLAALMDAATTGGADVLSTGDSYDDFPSVAEASDGTVYVAYAAYYDKHDQIRLHRRFSNGVWSTRTHVPLVQARPDIWMPQIAVDAKDRVWVIWSEQVGAGDPRSAPQPGNWDLYARAYIDGRWGPLVRLTNDPKPDINHHVFTDRGRNIHVVWQAHPNNNGDIQYCRFDGERWSKPLIITSDAASDWYPRGAVDRQGVVWIAFDSYRNGDYDVFLTSVTGTKIGDVIPIATSKYYEAHATVACTPDGRVWVAWEQGGYNWGKDQGYWLRREKRNRGTALGSARSVRVACYFNRKVWAGPDASEAFPVGARGRATASAELASGPDGRLWLRLRQMIRARQRRRSRKAWTEQVTWLTPQGWAPAVTLPASAGRISVFSRIHPAADGSLLVAYSCDARAVENYHRPIHDNVLFRRIDKPADEVGLPELRAYEPPEGPANIPPWNAKTEAERVTAIRSHRVTIAGVEHRIVRGDLHRHTELSWDVGPGNDGSYLDFYRYMIDVAAMDFGAITDHQGGGHYAYWWWLTEKSADLYYLPPRFVPLYGYERSAKFPNGHRNIFHAYRGVPVFPFQITLDQSGVFPGIGSGALVENDTKLLYQYLHGTGGIAISHTSGTSTMGTDWRDNDPVIEPVVEIYQGCRNSYETLGGPRVHSQDAPPQRAPGGFQKAGLVWNAYAKGYRLGTIASSDHGSTHISYALVYTPKADRQAILDSIRKRHTYGATDNLIVTFEANGHFMGDEFATSELPTLKLEATGTGKIAQIDLIRNNEYIYTAKPNKRRISLKYTDMKPVKGTSWYYFRLVQEDGEVAWCSPVWVNRE
ncbi:MAG: hypothetical protein GXP27_19515 [Planctomycetes bacterium]|nr:hypothetical protein [Planctomycetota bacterium]